MDDRLRGICLARGVFLRSEALALGYDDRTIAYAVHAGIWHRVRRGAYTFADMGGCRRQEASRDHGPRSRPSGRTDVVLSHTSAALEHIPIHWGLDLSDVHLTRLDARSARAGAGVAA